MAQVSKMDVEVRPSQNYQTVGFSATLTFDPPVELEAALFEADLAYAKLESLAGKRVNELSELRNSNVIVPATAASIAAPIAGVSPIDSATWPTAFKPAGAGTFKYLPSSVVPKDRFVSMVTEKLPELGIDPEQVVVYDDRGGDRGIENGGQSYTVGKVKVKPDTRLAAAMNGKQILANVDFEIGGAVKVSLSRDGRAALQAMQIAGQLAEPAITPF